jgi:hypothetical protein
VAWSGKSGRRDDVGLTAGRSCSFRGGAEKVDRGLGSKGGMKSVDPAGFLPMVRSTVSLSQAGSTFSTPLIQPEPALGKYTSPGSRLELKDSRVTVLFGLRVVCFP